MNKVRVGVIGAGFIGRVHIEQLRRLGYVDVVAVSEKDQATADAVAAELRIPKAYGRSEDLIKDKDLDAVHVATLNHLHYPLAKLALESGKHVLCEKPLAMNSAEAKDLLDTAKKTGRAHAICHNMRYYPLIKQARSMVQAGDIGTVRLVHGQYLQDWLFLETDYNWRLIAAVGGTSRAVADIGTHWLDAVQHITGQKVAAVYADLTTFIPVRKKPKVELATFVVKQLSPEDYEDVAIDTEDHGTIMIKFSGGAKGVLIACQVCAGRKNYIHFEINGTKRSLEWNGQEPNTMWVGERGRSNGEFIKDPVLFYPEAAPYGYAPCGLGEGYLDTFRSVFSDFHSWILSGKPMDVTKVPFPTFLTGLSELNIVDAVLESAKKNAWVDVKYQVTAGPDYM
ncbi:MAG: Gfo/Idh/MocA family oxidoreductase [Spirochaetia bacterium]